MKSISLPELFIIESLGPGEFRDAKGLSRVLLVDDQYRYVRYRYVKTLQGLKKAAKEFKRSKHRWLHLSCHGVVTKKGKGVGLALHDGTQLSPEKIAKVLSGKLNKRRLFISACVSGERQLAAAIFRRNPRCHSIVACGHSPHFGASFVYWAAFYYLMAQRAEYLPTEKTPPMKRQAIRRLLTSLDKLFLNSVVRYFTWDRKEEVVRTVK